MLALLSFNISAIALSLVSVLASAGKVMSISFLESAIAVALNNNSE